ncbi:MAG: four helix bundle protein [Candidatus Paceibacterota bacterium]
MELSRFEKLNIWTESYRLTKNVYRLTVDCPAIERYGLVSQVRRSASSVGVNIAEGSGKRTSGDFRRFLAISKGSVYETIQHLMLLRDLSFVDSDMVSSTIDDYRRLAASFASFSASLE